MFCDEVQFAKCHYDMGSKILHTFFCTSDYVTIILKAETNNKVYSAFPTYMQPIPPSDYVCFIIEVQFSKWCQYPTIADYSSDCLC